MFPHLCAVSPLMRHFWRLLILLCFHGNMKSLRKEPGFSKWGWNFIYTTFSVLKILYFISVLFFLCYFSPCSLSKQDTTFWADFCKQLISKAGSVQLLSQLSAICCVSMCGRRRSIMHIACRCKETAMMRDEHPHPQTLTLNHKHTFI